MGARGVFDAQGVLQHVVLGEGTSFDRGLDGTWSRPRENPGEVQVVKTGHGDVVGPDNEKVIDTKTGDTIAYRQVKDDHGRRLSQPTVLLPDGVGGWKQTSAPVDVVSYEAWLAGANQAHDTARTMFDIAGRSDVSIPEPERLTHLGTEELKELLGGTPDDMRAALYEAVRRTKGVSLRWTQLAAGGAFERGDVVNMAAGEGKSYLFLMSNALEAAKLAKAGQGGAVHMHTTRDVLAEQLEPDFRAVMEPLGYAVHRLNSDHPPPPPKEGQPTVYLGTSQDAAFTLLKHGSVGGRGDDGAGGGSGPGFHAEIDEIDEALVYSHGHYILSEGTGADAAAAVADPIKGMREFLSDKLASGELTEADFGREPDTVGGPAQLTQVGVAKATALLNPHGELAPAQVEGQLGKLNMAGAAHWEYVENVHYVIDDKTGKLYIIDQTTHQVLYDPRTSSESRWNGGLAQALEAKHGLAVRHDSDGDKKVTSHGLYEKYAQVVGASGTANGKNELFAKQGLSSQIADISRYYRSGLSTHDIEVSANLKDKLATIAGDVAQMQELGDTARPQLILAHRNDLVAQISAQLGQRNVAHVAIDAKWFLRQGVDRDEAFKEVVAQAGKPGAVLVINMQGARGVDIPLDDHAKALGGLHVVVTGHSGVSKDIDIQAENRAARSGDRGSVKYYISPDDDLFRLSDNPQVQLAVIQYRTALHTGTDTTPAQQGLRDAVPLSQNDAALRMGIRQGPPSRAPPTHTAPTDSHHPGDHRAPDRPPPPTNQDPNTLEGSANRPFATEIGTGGIDSGPADAHHQLTDLDGLYGVGADSDEPAAGGSKVGGPGVEDLEASSSTVLESGVATTPVDGAAVATSAGHGGSPSGITTEQVAGSRNPSPLQGSGAPPVVSPAVEAPNITQGDGTPNGTATAGSVGDEDAAGRQTSRRGLGVVSADASNAGGPVLDPGAVSVIGDPPSQPPRSPRPPVAGSSAPPAREGQLAEGITGASGARTPDVEVETDDVYLGRAEYEAKHADDRVEDRSAGGEVAGVEDVVRLGSLTQSETNLGDRHDGDGDVDPATEVTVSPQPSSRSEVDVPFTLNSGEGVSPLAGGLDAVTTSAARPPRAGPRGNHDRDRTPTSQNTEPVEHHDRGGSPEVGPRGAQNASPPLHGRSDDLTPAAPRTDLPDFGRGAGESDFGAVGLRWIGSQWDAVRGHPEFGSRLEAVYGWLSPNGGELAADDYRLDEYRRAPMAQAALRVLYMWHVSGVRAARGFADRQRGFRLRGGSESTGDDRDENVATDTSDGHEDSDGRSTPDVQNRRVSPSRDVEGAAPVGEPLRVEVPGDGWCLLYAVVVSTPPLDWPAQWSSNAVATHAAILQQMGGRGRPAAALKGPAEALWTMVEKWVASRAAADLPVEAIRAFRRSEEQAAVVHRLLHDVADDQSRREWLSTAGIEAPGGAAWVSAATLAARYDEVYAERRAAGEDEPLIRAGHGGDGAESSEMGLTVPELRFNYLQTHGGLPRLADLGGVDLALMIDGAYAQLPLTDEEYAGLLGSLGSWDTSWATSYGEMFPSLVAHTLGVHLQYGSLGGVNDYGVPDGPVVQVHHNGDNHYQAIIIQPHPISLAAHRDASTPIALTTEVVGSPYAWPTGGAAAAETVALQPLQLFFNEGVKTLDESLKTQIKNHAAYLIERATRRPWPFGDSDLVVVVEGGGNGRKLNEKRAFKTGWERAENTLEELRAEFNAQRKKFAGPVRNVVFTAKSRGSAYPEGFSAAADAYTKRGDIRSVVIRISDSGSHPDVSVDADTSSSSSRHSLRRAVVGGSFVESEGPKVGTSQQDSGSTLDTADSGRGVGAGRHQQVMIDSGGERFVSVLRDATVQLQALVGLPTPETIVIDDGVHRRVDGDPLNVAALSPEDRVTLVKHQIFDWLIGNHDAKAEHFGRNADGAIVGIHKDQAFSHFGRDKLNWDYRPHAHNGHDEPLYNTLWRDFSEGRGEGMPDPRTGDLSEFITRVQSIPDSDLRALLRPYAQQADAVGKLTTPVDEAAGSEDVAGDAVRPLRWKKRNNVDSFLNTVVTRKNNLANDFGSLYAEAGHHRFEVLTREAFHKISPRLSKYIEREDIPVAEMIGQGLRHFTLPRRPDGELSYKALSDSAADERKGFMIDAVARISDNAGVFVHGIGHKKLEALLKRDTAQLQAYPELQTYLDSKGKLATVAGVTRDTSSAKVVPTGKVDSAGLLVDFHSSQGDPWVNDRQDLVKDALSALRGTGLTLPPVLGVYLLRYGRRLDVTLTTDDHGHETLSITETEAGFDVYNGQFSAPGLLILNPSALMPNSTGNTTFSVSSMMQNTGWGVVLHELAHAIHFNSDRLLYTDLLVTEFSPADQALVAKISTYAASAPAEFVPEYLVSLMLGRDLSHDIDADGLARLKVLFESMVGKKLARQHIRPIQPPDLTADERRDLVHAVREAHGFTDATEAQILKAETQLPLFDRWRLLSKRAELVADRLRMTGVEPATASTQAAPGQTRAEELDRPPVTVDQHQAFGVRTHFDDLDREGEGGPPLLRLELRADLARRLTPDQLGSQYDDLTGIVRASVDRANAADTPDVASGRSTLRRQVSRMWNLSTSRFGAPGDESGWPMSATAHTAESLAKRYPWLGAVNPERDSVGAQTNCVMSAIAFVISQREGRSFEAPHTESLPGRDLLNFHRQSLGLADGEDQVSVMPDLQAAAEALRSAGEGSMALIAVRGDDSGIDHVYVGVVDHLGVTFLDPQSGTVAREPVGATLAMLPLTPRIPTPRGARRLTADESVNSDTDRVVSPLQPHAVGPSEHVVQPTDPADVTDPDVIDEESNADRDRPASPGTPSRNTAEAGQHGVTEGELRLGTVGHQSENDAGPDEIASQHDLPTHIGPNPITAFHASDEHALHQKGIPADIATVSDPTPRSTTLGGDGPGSDDQARRVVVVPEAPRPPGRQVSAPVEAQNTVGPSVTPTPVTAELGATDRRRLAGDPRGRSEAPGGFEQQRGGRRALPRVPVPVVTSGGAALPGSQDVDVAAGSVGLGSQQQRGDSAVSRVSAVGGLVRFFLEHGEDGGGGGEWLPSYTAEETAPDAPPRWSSLAPLSPRVTAEATGIGTGGDRGAGHDEPSPPYPLPADTGPHRRDAGRGGGLGGAVSAGADGVGRGVVGAVRARLQGHCRFGGELPGDVDKLIGQAYAAVVGSGAGGRGGQAWVAGSGPDVVDKVYEFSVALVAGATLEAAVHERVRGELVAAGELSEGADLPADVQFLVRAVLSASVSELMGPRLGFFRDGHSRFMVAEAARRVREVRALVAEVVAAGNIEVSGAMVAVVVTAVLDSYVSGAGRGGSSIGAPGVDERASLVAALIKGVNEWMARPERGKPAPDDAGVVFDERLPLAVVNAVRAGLRGGERFGDQQAGERTLGDDLDEVIVRQFQATESVGSEKREAARRRHVENERHHLVTGLVDTVRTRLAQQLQPARTGDRLHPPGGAEVRGGASAATPATGSGLLIPSGGSSGTTTARAGLAGLTASLAKAAGIGAISRAVRRDGSTRSAGDAGRAGSAPSATAGPVATTTAVDPQLASAARELFEQMGSRGGFAEFLPKVGQRHAALTGAVHKMLETHPAGREFDAAVLGRVAQRVLQTEFLTLLAPRAAEFLEFGHTDYMVAALCAQVYVRVEVEQSLASAVGARVRTTWPAGASMSDEQLRRIVAAVVEDAHREHPVAYTALVRRPRFRDPDGLIEELFDRVMKLLGQGGGRLNFIDAETVALDWEIVDAVRARVLRAGAVHESMVTANLIGQKMPDPRWRAGVDGRIQQAFSALTRDATKKHLTDRESRNEEGHSAAKQTLLSESTRTVTARLGGPAVEDGPGASASSASPHTGVGAAAHAGSGRPSSSRLSARHGRGGLPAWQVVPAPADGWCLLHAAATGMGSAPQDAAAIHAQVLDWVGARTGEQMPAEAVTAFRNSPEQSRLITDEIDRLDHERRIGWLSDRGVTEVQTSRWLSPEELRQRYVSARMQQFRREDPALSGPDAERDAQEEVALTERGDLAERALSGEAQLDYLRQHGAAPRLHHLSLQDLGTAIRETFQHEPLTDAEYAALLDSLRQWQSRNHGWNTGYGEMFPALVAHALNVQLHILDRHTFAPYATLGPATGLVVPVAYNGANHYDGITAHQTPAPRIQPRPAAPRDRGPDRPPSPPAAAVAGGSGVGVGHATGVQVGSAGGPAGAHPSTRSGGAVGGFGEPGSSPGPAAVPGGQPGTDRPGASRQGGQPTGWSRVKEALPRFRGRVGDGQLRGGSGRGGLEAQYLGGMLGFPPHQWLLERDGWEALAALKDDVDPLAINEGAGLRVSMSIGQFQKLQEDVWAMPQSAAGSGGDVHPQPILNFVTTWMFAPLGASDTGRGGRDARKVLKTLADVLRRLDALPRPTGIAAHTAPARIGEHTATASFTRSLGEVFPAGEGWVLQPSAKDVRFMAVRKTNAAKTNAAKTNAAKTNAAETYALRHLMEVPLGSLETYMGNVAPLIEHERHREVHEDGRRFAETVAEMSRTDPMGARLGAVEQRELRGAMWLTYVHTAAITQTTETVSSVPPWYFSALSLRSPGLWQVRSSLSEPVRDFLATHVDRIRTTFEQHYEDRHPDFGSRYRQAAEGRAARFVDIGSDTATEEIPQDDNTRPLAAVRHKSALETHHRNEMLVGDYLSMMLMNQPLQVIDQREAFGVAVAQDVADTEATHSGEPAPLVLEFRIGAERNASKDIVVRYRHLTETIVGTPTPTAAGDGLGRLRSAWPPFGSSQSTASPIVALASTPAPGMPTATGDAAEGTPPGHVGQIEGSRDLPGSSQGSWVDAQHRRGEQHGGPAGRFGAGALDGVASDSLPAVSPAAVGESGTPDGESGSVTQVYRADLAVAHRQGLRRVLAALERQGTDIDPADPAKLREFAKRVAVIRGGFEPRSDHVPGEISPADPGGVARGVATGAEPALSTNSGLRGVGAMSHEDGGVSDAQAHSAVHGDEGATRFADAGRFGLLSDLGEGVGAADAVDSRLVAAVSGLGAWDGVSADCVARVDGVLSYLMGGPVTAGVTLGGRGRVGMVASGEADVRPVDRLAGRLGGRFVAVGGVDGFSAGLGRGGVTAVWVARPGDSMHVVLVARDVNDGGLVLVETQPDRGGSFVGFADPSAAVTAAGRLEQMGGLPAALRGPLRVLVDDQGRLVQLDLRHSGRVEVVVGESPVNPGTGLVHAVLDPARTVSPGMAPKRGKASAVPVAASVSPVVHSWPADVQTKITQSLSRAGARFSDLTRLQSLPDEQFHLVVDVLQKDPDFAVAFARRAAEIAVIVEKWPNVFDGLVAQISPRGLAAVDLSYFVKPGDAAGIFDRFERDRGARSGFLDSSGLAALRALGPRWESLLSHGENYLTSYLRLVIASLPGLGEAIQKSGAPALMVRELVHSPGLLEMFRTIASNHVDEGGVWRVGPRWTVQQYDTLFGNGWLFEELRVHPVLAWAVVNLSGVLEAVAGDRTAIGQWVAVLDGHRGLVDVLLESPALSGRLAADLRLFGVAAGNAAVAALLSVDPRRFDTVSDEELVAALGAAAGPEPPPPPVPVAALSPAVQAALAAHPGLRLAALGDWNHSGVQPQSVTATWKALTNPKRAGIVAVLAGLELHPHEYRHSAAGRRPRPGPARAAGKKPAHVAELLRCGWR